MSCPERSSWRPSLKFVKLAYIFCAILAGGSGMPWPKFLFFNATGAVVWSVAVAAAGYSLAYSWERLQRWIGDSGLIALLIVAALIAVAVVRARWEQKS